MNAYDNRLGSTGINGLRHRETLRLVPLFRSLSDEQVRRLDTQCLWQRFDAGAEILSFADTSGTDVYFVVAGSVRVRNREDERDVILRDIPAGGWFGELAAIDGGGRSASIVALSGTTVARMPPAVFRAALHAHPTVCDDVLAVLAAQIRMLARRVTEQTAFDVPRRVRAELLRLAAPSRQDGLLKISPPPLHAEIAARIGCKREAVTRELGRLHRSGIIEKRRGALVILDPDALRQAIKSIPGEA